MIEKEAYTDYYNRDERAKKDWLVVPKKLIHELFLGQKTIGDLVPHGPALGVFQKHDW